MTTTPEKNKALVERFYNAMMRRDFDEILNDIYARDARIWHNHDNREQTAEENVGMLRAIGDIATLKVNYLERIDHPRGCVQRNKIEFTLKNGKSFDIDNCLFFTIENGKFSYIIEYVDGVVVLNLSAALKEMGVG